MKITIRLFAALADRANQREIALTLDNGATVLTALEQLSEVKPELKTIGAAVLLAVNQQYVKPDHSLHDGDELAVFPPVSGG